MKRREFTAGAATLGLAGALSPLGASAQAGGMPAENLFVRLTPKQKPVLAPAGKIEVIEFFSYGCPHCFEFEPTLEAWVAKLPTDVEFHRVPVNFLPGWRGLQRLHYALEILKKTKKGEIPPAKIFLAVQETKLQFDKPEVAADFAVKNGIKREDFMGAYNAFNMNNLTTRAGQLSETYGAPSRGVPLLAIAGQYLTAPFIAQSEQRALAAADQLIAVVRKGG